MNSKARAVVFLLVILGLAASLAPGNLSSHITLTAVPPKMTGSSAGMFDGTQPPVPPKAVAV